MFRSWFKMVEILFPVIAHKWAVRLFFTPPKFKTPNREKSFTKKATVSKVDFRIIPEQLYKLDTINKMLSYKDFNSAREKDHYTLYELGEGKETVLLSHGWAGRASQMGSIAEALAECGYRTITFDAFAHVNNPGEQTTVIEFAEIIKHIHKNYGPFKAVIGHSLGGIALGNAILAGMKTEKLVTIGSPTTFQYILEEFCDIINAGNKTLEYIRQFVLQYANAKIEDFSLENIGEKLTLPGLIIHDTEDKEAPYSQALLFDKSWEKGTLITSRGLGHSRILRDKKIISLIVDFVTSKELSQFKLDPTFTQSEVV